MFSVIGFVCIILSFLNHQFSNIKAIQLSTYFPFARGTRFESRKLMALVLTAIPYHYTYSLNMNELLLIGTLKSFYPSFYQSFLLFHFSIYYATNILIQNMK